jgi:acetate kinase
MKKYIIVINAGSSSIKFAIYQTDVLTELLDADAFGHVEGIGNQLNFMVKSSEGLLLLERQFTNNNSYGHMDALTLILDWLREYLSNETLLAVGHRVVHGGQHYSAPVMVDANVLAKLETLVPLAPLHQPHSLAIIRTLLKSMPELLQVACFDTAFHRTQLDVAQCFAIPRHFFDEGIRHYGFHGLSYEYIASRLPTLEPTLADARIIVAHLGSGASLCALVKGQSIATTMGFSPLDGLVMGTRCGAIDPGVLLFLMDCHGMDARTLEHLLYYESGLLGVSGISNDMRILLASDDLRAQEAIELFVYRVGREVGSLAAALGGLDALVFTGGIGEHSSEIREKICHHAAWLGLELDDNANTATATRISRFDSKVSAWIVPTDENLIIAQQTLRQVTVNKDIS